MDVQIGLKVSFVAKFRDAAGNDAVVDVSQSPAEVLVDDPTRAAIEDLAADGLSGFVRVLGIGPITVNITADADLGAGTRRLTIVGTLNGIAGEAVAGVIEFGAPVA